MNQRKINIIQNVVIGVTMLFIVTILFLALYEPITVTLFGTLEDEAEPILDKYDNPVNDSTDYSEYITFLITIFGVSFCCLAIACVVGMYLYSVKQEHEEFEEYEKYY